MGSMLLALYKGNNHYIEVRSQKESGQTTYMGVESVDRYSGDEVGGGEGVL